MTARFYALLLLAVLGSVPACLGNAHAQDVSWCELAPEDHATLAFAAHHEAGDSVADAAAIHHVLRTLAEGRGQSFAGMARRYMPHAFAGSTERAAWSATFGPFCAPEPDAHPRERSWLAIEREWFGAWVAAEEVLAGAHALECDGTFHDWGSPEIDRDRAARLGLIPVACTVDGAVTRNDLYARPSWRRRGE